MNTMNNEFYKFLNPSEYLSTKLPSIIEAFVMFYGEDERQSIEEKFKNTLIIGTVSPTYIEKMITQDKITKSKKLKEQFLEELMLEKKKYNCFFGDNIGFSQTPIENYINYIEQRNKENPYQPGDFMYSLMEEVKKANRDQNIQFLNSIGYSINENNIEEFILSGEMDLIIKKYVEISNEYRQYEQEIETYTQYIDKCNKIKIELDKKYKKQTIIELKDLFTEEEYQKIIKAIDDNISIGDVSRKCSALFSNDFWNESLIDSFTIENQQILKNDDSWKNLLIKRDQIEYFKICGLNLGNEYDEYIKYSTIENLIPSQQIVQRIVKTRKELQTKMFSEYIQSTSDYIQNKKRIEKENLLDKSIHLENDYYNENSYVGTNIKIFNEQIIPYPLLIFACNPNNEHLDQYLIHELNHRYELYFNGLTENKMNFSCGWDILNSELGEKQDETLEKPNIEKRKYELFNEIINELIAQEITSILHKNNNYIFNNKDNAKIKGALSYEHTKFLVLEFYEKYKQDIILSRKNNNLNIIYEKLGKENFEALNDLFNEFYQYFDDGQMRKTKIDIKNDNETSYTKKIKELMQKRDEILNNMETYSNTHTTKL